MVAVKRSLVAIIFTCLIATSSAFGSASNIYITQNGSPSGSCTSNVQTPAFFNNSSNWGNGSSQIGPGTTVLLCGALTVSSGGAGLTVLGSGTSSNPITILFDSGASLQAPYIGGSDTACPGPECVGGITIDGHDYIVVDGGTNGQIFSTANGTKLSNHQDAVGIALQNCAGCVIRNLNVHDIYDHVDGTDSNGDGSADITVMGTIANLQIYNNILTQAKTGLHLSPEVSSTVLHTQAVCPPTSTSSTDVNVCNNTIQDHCWMINAGGTNAANIYNNQIGGAGALGWNNWVDPQSMCHTDGIIAFGDSSSAFTPQIYNNIIEGDLDSSNTGSPTGMIFCTYGGPGSGSACSIYNNLIVDMHAGSCCSAIYLHAASGSNRLGPHTIYNNTIVNFGNGGAQITFEGDTSTHLTIENNVGIGDGATTYFEALATNGSSTTTSQVTANNNDWYDGRTGGPFSGIGSSCTYGCPLSTWQSQNKLDVQSISTNPNLSSSYQIQGSSSPAYNLGMNLTTLGIASLDIGQPTTVGVGAVGVGGVDRPESGTWNAGAYQYSGVTPPAPPTALTAVVQ